MTIDIGIHIAAGAWPDDDELEPRFSKVAQQVFDHLGFANVATELSILLTDDDEIRELNAKWRGLDKPTNVLSFPSQDLKPGDQPGSLMGDIALAYETLMREADEQCKPFQAHLTHLFVHGLLHLLGYDHENDTDAALMEGLEIDILASMKIPNPYATELDGN